MTGSLGPPEQPVGTWKQRPPPPCCPSGYLPTALALLVLAHPAILGWIVGAGVVRGGWMSRRRLAAAASVTGTLALLIIGPTVAAGSLLGAVAALGTVLPATLLPLVPCWRP